MESFSRQVDFLSSEAPNSGVMVLQSGSFKANRRIAAHFIFLNIVSAIFCWLGRAWLPLH
jgi:hypothetical protein